MKKAILCLLLLTVTAISFSQQGVPVVPSQEEYLQKNRSQNTGAWLLSGLGLACLAGALTYDVNHIFDASAANTTGIYVAGLSSLGGGVALFLAAGRNKRKAREMTPSLKMDRAALPAGAALKVRCYPSLSLTVPL